MLVPPDGRLSTQSGLCWVTTLQKPDSDADGCGERYSARFSIFAIFGQRWLALSSLHTTKRR